MKTDSAPKVLLVDDEESVLETMAAILSQEGYRVTPASTVKDALQHLRSDQFDLLLTDLRIDTDSGLTLLAEVRERAPETASIMLTGYASIESAIDALREGAYDYLVKPCHVDELKATVRRGIERSVLSRTLRDRVEELDAANAQLRQLSSELQDRVDQATADLRQNVDELAAANHRLEEASRLREEFISMAAHELKTPVTSLRASAQLLQRRLDRGQGVDEDALRRGFRLIDQQSDKLARLISQMMDVTRIEAGRLSLELEEVDLAQLVRDVVESEQTKSEDHRVVFDGPEQLTAEIDPLRIDQVLTNLIDNAIKYSPDGGDVRVELSAPTDGTVQVSVTDQGEGIPPEHRGRIFERFYRAHSDRHLTGIGLGLYITRQIVEHHGGQIHAEFPPEGGTRFILRLPAMRGAALATSR
jgi:signal transduction histidine kinase